MGQLTETWKENTLHSENTLKKNTMMGETGQMLMQVFCLVGFVIFIQQVRI